MKLNVNFMQITRANSYHYLQCLRHFEREICTQLQSNFEDETRVHTDRHMWVLWIYFTKRITMDLPAITQNFDLVSLGLYVRSMFLHV
jgi:hypothetical protein